jgi:hypothetical protein
VADYKGWADAVFLSNGTAEVVVVPAISRVMHFGLAGQPNVLWENAWVAGQAPGQDQWSNYGGDKVWIWPQVDWPARTGTAWPPATDLPATIASAAERIDPLGVRLTSVVIPGFGVRIVREVRLAPEGTRLLLSSRIEKQEGFAAFPLAPWTVTQVPADGACYLRLLPKGRLPEGYRLHESEAFASVEREGDDVLVIRRPTSHWAKLGADADLLAWQQGNTLLVARSEDRQAILSDFAPGDRGQVYSHPDGDKVLPPGISYLELEFTAPVRQLASGDTGTLVTVLDIRNLGEHEPSQGAVASVLRSFP